MKKILIAAAVAGLVAVPSLVSARHGADDNSTTPDVRQEDRRQDRREDRQQDRQNEVNDDRVTGVDSSTNSSTSTSSSAVAGTSTSRETVVGGVKVETEATLPADAVSLNTAQATAQAKYPTKTITKVEIENEHGSVVYSFRFSDGSRVDVDAVSGAVVRSEDDSRGNNEEDRNDDSRNNSGRHGSNSGRDHAEDN